MRFQSALLSAFIFAVFMSTAAQAETRLTEENIRALYKENVEAFKLPHESYVEFLQNSMTDDYKVTVNVNVAVGGQQQISQTENSDKAKIIQHAKVNQYLMKDATVLNSVKSVKIAADGQSAVIEDYSVIKNVLIPNPGQNPLYADIKGACRDRVVLSSKNTLQIQQSACRHDMVVRPGRAL